MFARKLAHIGYAVAWKGDSFDIDGLSAGLLRKFSRRTAHIEHVAETLGITSDHVKDKLGAITREKKQSDATMPQLRELWRRRLTADERHMIGQAASGPAYRRIHPPRPRDAWEQQRLNAAHLRQRRAAFRVPEPSASPAPPPPTRYGGAYG